MRKLELLAPGGDIESIKAAIVAGADAIYCGLGQFNARTRAENLSFNELNGLLRVAHQHSCKLFLTLNIIILEQELPALLKLLNQLVNTRIDGVIVQDFGLFYILKHHYPTLDIHASTQVTTHNSGQLEFLHHLGASRANLSRELNLAEISQMSAKAHTLNMSTEVFVHGSNCIGFSGLCYFSSAHGGNSGNRGRCSQPCRDQYQTTEAGADYPFNLKDNCAFSDLAALANAGVDSLKVEGRIKKSHYVYTVIDNWRKQLTRLKQNEQLSDDKKALYTVFNRDFTTGYLKSNVGQQMYIDNPRDNAVLHFTALKSDKTPHKSIEQLTKEVKKSLYDEKSEIIKDVNNAIAKLNIDKLPIKLHISGKVAQPLTITISSESSPKASLKGEDKTSSEQQKLAEIVVKSSSLLKPANRCAIDYNELAQRFTNIQSADYELSALSCDQLEPDLFIPFKELTEMKRQLSYHLNGHHPVPPVSITALKATLPPVANTKLKSISKTVNTKTDREDPPQLTVLISNRRELALYFKIKREQDSSPNSRSHNVRFYYQLPDALAQEQEQLQTLFNNNPELTPWFGAIIMEPDFVVAKQLLRTLKPKQIVSNNSGIGFEAYQQGIDWIAGPYLNITNSISIHALRLIGCVGAFISNELNRIQIAKIGAPANFELHYSFLHPILLMSSRQCLFLQSSGCHKDKQLMDSDCLNICKKNTTVTNIKGINFIIDKKRREHNLLIGSKHFYNPDIITDLPNKFSGLMIDLRAINTETNFINPSHNLIEILNNYLIKLDNRDKEIDKIKSLLINTTRTQYNKGL